MCGRFSMAFTAADLEDRFALDDPVDFEITPRYNIAPTQHAPVVLMRDGRRRLESLRWGLIPSWAKDASIGSRMINARAETAATSNAFRSAFRSRRCLAPATGFYEWKKGQGGGRKVPYHFTMQSGAPLALAGLWEVWSPPGSAAPVHSFTIITTCANALVAPVHDRMPVILSPDAYARWLDPDTPNPADLAALLVPYSSGYDHDSLCMEEAGDFRLRGL